MRGFVFNDITVSNKHDIFYINSTVPESPPISYFEFDAPKRNGSTYYFNKYRDKEIAITVGIKAKTLNELNAKKRILLQSIVGIKGKLIFLHEPELYYNAEVLNEISSERYGNYIELTIPFTCSYCKYGIDDKNIILKSGANHISNDGNLEAQTIFEIIAKGTGDVTITGDSNSFKIANMAVGERVYVDSEKMIVYKIIDNKKVSAMQRHSGKFIIFTPGSNNISVSGVNADVTVSFRDTYIV